MKAVKLEVFDPPMCCSSGVCGPNVDNRLVKFSAALDWLRSLGAKVERYNPSFQYDAFAGNATVVEAINDGGLGCLPLILVNGVIVSRGAYPSKEKLAAMTNLAGGAAVSEVQGRQRQTTASI